VDVHRGDARGRVTQDRDREKDAGIPLDVVAKRRLAGALHREDHVAGIPHGRREGTVVLGILGGVIERNVERDDARALRLERSQEVGVSLVRQRISVLIHGLVIERDDRHLVRDGWIPDVDRLVVHDRLKGRVEELSAQKERADQQGGERQARDDEPLARVALSEHRARLLLPVGVRLCGRSLG